MMKKLVLTGLACALGVSACSQLREPNDAQLTALLRSERAQPTDENALLDTKAIECLRAWSGDAQLAKGLPPALADLPGKKQCRIQIDAWIAQPARNADKFTFEEVSEAKAVQHAITLQAARHAAILANPASHQIPPALVRGATPAVAQGPRAPDPTVDLGAAGGELKEAETLCQQLQPMAAAANADAGLKSFATYCNNSLRQLRGSMEQAAHNGQGNAQLDGIAKSATALANIARKKLAAAAATK